MDSTDPLRLVESLTSPPWAERLGPGLSRRLALVVLLSSTLSPGGRPLSGEELAQVLGLTRAAVHKHVEHLRILGFRVDSVVGSGYRLGASFSDLVVPEAVLPYLLGLFSPSPGSRAKAQSLARTVEDSAGVGGPAGPTPRLVGLPYHYLKECTSTNLVAREWAPRLPSGGVVVTDRQTSGRGRLGRTWLSEPGKDLTFSVVLRPPLVPAQAQLVSLAAGLSVAEVLEETLALRGAVGLKWPNDVLLGGRKVCGILVEGSMDADRLHWAVVGVGLNVNSQTSDLPNRMLPGGEDEWRGRPVPISLAEYLGRPVERAPLLAALLAHLGERCCRLESPGALLAAWHTRDVLIGRQVEVTTGRRESVVQGTAVGLGPEGQLLVREGRGVRQTGVSGVTSGRGQTAGRVTQVFAGDVSVRELPTL